MQDWIWLTLGVAALGITAMLALRWGQSRSGPTVARLQAERDALLIQCANSEEEVDQLRERLSTSHASAAAMQARLEEQAKSFAEKTQMFKEMEQQFQAAFKNLSQQILDERSAKFAEQSQTQIGGLLLPLKEQLKEFQDLVGRTHASDQKERGAIIQQIQSLSSLNQKLSDEAKNLTRALKGDSRSQGVWGEQVLERLLEMSGLTKGRNYDVQQSFTQDDGGRARPDVILHLPDEKDLVIDSKVSLTAYERMSTAETEGERAIELKEHVNSLRRHIDGLARRDYSQLPGVRSLDFVLLFVPIEAAYIEALRADEQLHDFALNKNIALVSTSTLLPTLRTVSHLWRMEDRNANAAEISRQAGALHDSFVMLENDLTGVGDYLKRALDTHEGVLKRLSSGKGNLLRRVDLLRQLGADTRKQLSAARLEAAESDEAD